MVRPAASEPLNLPESPFAARSRAARRLHVRLPYLLYLPLSVTACLTRTRAGSGGAFIGMSPFPAASILLIVTLSGCRDHRIIQPTLALPRPGEPIPSFDLPLRGTWRLASADLHGRPSVLFLWSTHCPTSRRALAEYRRSTTSPERDTARVVFVLPAYVVVGQNGRVAGRSWGPDVSPVRSILDSLLASRPAS
jgi:hypothetical protein